MAPVWVFGGAVEFGLSRVLRRLAVGLGLVVRWCYRLSSTFEHRLFWHWLEKQVFWFPAFCAHNHRACATGISVGFVLRVLASVKTRVSYVNISFF
jgi:hypothetical protein